jgi:hypothetical protein
MATTIPTHSPETHRRVIISILVAILLIIGALIYFWNPLLAAWQNWRTAHPKSSPAIELPVLINSPAPIYTAIPTPTAAPTPEVALNQPGSSNSYAGAPLPHTGPEDIITVILFLTGSIVTGLVVYQLRQRRRLRHEITHLNIY